nr:type VI secretion system tip protein TssI/VgrG [Trinickia mobilis]
MPQLIGQPALQFLSMSGGEMLSRIDYSYTLQLRTPDDYHVPLSSSANLDLKALLGKEMTVTIQLEGMGEGVLGGVGAGKREISGLVVKAGYLRKEARYHVYSVELRPWLWLATLTTDYKIFQDKTVIDIIDEVLKDYPYPVEKRLDVAKYAVKGDSERNEPRAFQVQYGETDYGFIQRLMEEWGIYWFFEHSEGKHRLVLCDHIGAHRKSDSEAYQTIAYQPQNGKSDAEYISAFNTYEAIRPGCYLTSDYDFIRPGADLSAVNQQPRETSWNTQERFEWPGNFADSKHGERVARTRMEELRAPGTRAHGEGNVRGLGCGQTFVLSHYDHTDANREYLVISSKLTLVEIAQESGSGYQYDCDTKFEVQPTAEVFRPPRVTSKPLVNGPQSAIVVGPAGEELWTDEFGRVKVRFLWDRYAQEDETDSCWVRVSQAWAGSNFGGIYIPRIGQEVIVDFWGGDPDRPLITGSLYNNTTRPPWDLPKNATQSGFMSRTVTGGRENYNGFRFEDKAGQEEFMMQAEKDMNRLTKHCESHTVGFDFSLGVGLAYGLNVGGLLACNVGGAAAYTVGGAQSVSVGGAAAMNVGGAYAISVGKDFSIVCGDASLTMKSDGTIKLIGKKVKVEGADKVIVQGSPLDLNPGDSDSGDGFGFGFGALLPMVTMRMGSMRSGPLPPKPTESTKFPPLTEPPPTEPPPTEPPPTEPPPTEPPPTEPPPTEPPPTEPPPTEPPPPPPPPTESEI